MIAATYRLCSK